MRLTKNKPLINEKYTKNMQELLLKQYEVFVKSSENISLKRMSANKFYVGLNTAIFAIASYASVLSSMFVTTILSFIGIFLCLAWISNISSYKRLNSAKFKVIHELEEYLPARPFSKEDDYLNGNYKLTKVEKYIPFLFIVLYGLIIFVFLPKMFSFLVNNINMGGLTKIWT